MLRKIAPYLLAATFLLSGCSTSTSQEGNDPISVSDVSVTGDNTNASTTSDDTDASAANITTDFLRRGTPFEQDSVNLADSGFLTCNFAEHIFEEVEAPEGYCEGLQVIPYEEEDGCPCAIILNPVVDVIDISRSKDVDNFANRIDVVDHRVETVEYWFPTILNAQGDRGDDVYYQPEDCGYFCENIINVDMTDAVTAEFVTRNTVKESGDTRETLYLKVTKSVPDVLAFGYALVYDYTREDGSTYSDVETHVFNELRNETEYFHIDDDGFGEYKKPDRLYFVANYYDSGKKEAYEDPYNLDIEMQAYYGSNGDDKNRDKFHANILCQLNQDFVGYAVLYYEDSAANYRALDIDAKAGDIFVLEYYGDYDYTVMAQNDEITLDKLHVYFVEDADSANRSSVALAMEVGQWRHSTSDETWRYSYYLAPVEQRVEIEDIYVAFETADDGVLLSHTTEARCVKSLEGEGYVVTTNASTILTGGNWQLEHTKPILALYTVVDV